MNLKDILVHIDNRPTCASRLAVAIQLAKQQDARLSGLSVIPHPYYAPHHRPPQSSDPRRGRDPAAEDDDCAGPDVTLA